MNNMLRYGIMAQQTSQQCNGQSDQHHSMSRKTQSNPHSIVSPRQPQVPSQQQQQQQHYLHHWRTVLFLLNSSNSIFLILSMKVSDHTFIQLTIIEIHFMAKILVNLHLVHSSRMSSLIPRIMSCKSESFYSVSIVRWHTRSGFCKDVNRRQ